MPPSLPAPDHHRAVARAVRHLRVVPPVAPTAGVPTSPEDRPSTVSPDHPSVAVRPPTLRVVEGEDGSLVAEYGLLVVLGATLTMLATKWATGGAVWSLFGAVLSRARALVGA